MVGVALGDGNLSNPNGRATRLRITCDLRYKNLAKKIIKITKELLPDNKVSMIKRAKTYGDISCYSNKWEEWLGWFVGKGSKYKQCVTVPNWIKKNKIFSIECLRGLLETDGSIYNDRGYKMVGFVTIIPTLANDFIKIANNLGFKPTVYKIKTAKHDRYNIRLSKNVDEFIKLINFKKD